MKVKICGLTREADVDLARELGADYFGFIVYPGSPRGLDPKRAAALASRAPEGRRVLVDVEPDADRLDGYAEAGFDRFQLHARSPGCPAALSAWSERVGRERLWFAPRMAPGAAFPEAALDRAATFLVDAYAPGRVGGTGRTGDWAGFAALRERFPGTVWVLSGGLGPENVGAALEASGARTVDVNSGVEAAPGRKDPERLRRLFAALGRGAG